LSSKFLNQKKQSLVRNESEFDKTPEKQGHISGELIKHVKSFPEGQLRMVEENQMELTSEIMKFKKKTLGEKLRTNKLSRDGLIF
jgi:hypothetical protein